MPYRRQLSLIAGRFANFLAADNVLRLIVFDYAFSAIFYIIVMDDVLVTTDVFRWIVRSQLKDVLHLGFLTPLLLELLLSLTILLLDLRVAFPLLLLSDHFL